MKLEDLKIGQHVRVSCTCTGYITAIENKIVSLAVTYACPSFGNTPKRAWHILCQSIQSEVPEPEDPSLRALHPNPQPMQKELFP